jgi:hypothetical protein
MILTPDPSREVYIDGFVGAKFAMFDGKKRVLCQASWESLQDRAARDRTDQSDVRGTFEKHRTTIEKVASDHYDRGESNPVVRSGDY